ncbi:MAG: glutamate-1-semialdehyde 2,1-aminomutase [Chloroflexi bacterium]|nr:glutamate-1-semialdehyde 2,1-aminomutase [Chloroflexota bacterium]
MKTDNSHGLYEQALRYFPGGVNSPVRAFRAVGREPLFITRGRGSRIWDADDNESIDYVCSWGPLILGHAHPQVVAAIEEAAEKGTSFGAPTERETALAREISGALPSMERLRFVNSGTEATMSALRVARAYTGRNQVLKFEGCYHGHADSFLVRAGSGAATLGLPDSPGVPASCAQDTLLAPYNDIHAVERLFGTQGREIAAVIVEPVAANMGVVLPAPQFLEALRQITQAFGALLIFDEVITGFRVAYGGAQTLYNVIPDLTCLGKIIGGGLPVGAYGGKREIMEMVAPSGPVYQAGTLSGNPLAMAAGLATLWELGQGQVYTILEEKGRHLARGLREAAARTGRPFQVAQMGSLLTPFFASEEVVDYVSARAADTQAYARFFWGMLQRGVSLPPSQFEAAFISLAHTQADVDATIAAAQEVLREMAS